MDRRDQNDLRNLPVILVSPPTSQPLTEVLEGSLLNFADYLKYVTHSRSQTLRFQYPFTLLNNIEDSESIYLCRFYLLMFII